MLYLGIDIGKNNHVASLLDEKSNPLFKAFSFSNTTDGANSLIEKLSYYTDDIKSIEIGMEALLVVSLFFSVGKRIYHSCC